jgi:hypothetical protein
LFTATKTKTFLYNPVVLDPLTSEDTPNGRYYKTPMGNLPSVTTVLGRSLDKSGLEAWRKKVGEEEAAKILKQAGTRGSAVHQICEDYILGKDYKKGQMPFNLMSFNTIKPYLDRNLGTVYGVELPVYSKKLNTAGRTDLFAGYDGLNSVVDFKTSKRVKTEEHILSYFLQATCYAMMLEELTGYNVPQIVIVMSVDHEDSRVFVKKKDQYVDQVLDIFTR